MYLTKYTDISLRVVMHLAMHPDHLSTISQISSDYAVSRNHLVKVVHQLASAGFIATVQGRSGGIRLARGVHDISVGEIVREMEHTVEMVDCAANGCPITGSCKLKGVLDEAADAFFGVLDRYTINDLIHNRGQLLNLIASHQSTQAAV